MTQRNRTLQSNVALVDAVDYLLNRGAVLVGEAKLSLAGVDMVYVGLNLLVSAVENLPCEERDVGQAVLQPGRESRATYPLPQRSALASSMPSVARASGSLAGTLPRRDPQWYPAPAVEGPLGSLEQTRSEDEPASPGLEQGLAQLVLTLIELLREVMERQALRRVEGGSLDEEQIERIGVALMELDEKMDELCAMFEIRRDELNVDLGPLGRLLS